MPKRQTEQEIRTKIDEGAYDAIPLSMELPEDSTYRDPKGNEKVTEKVTLNYEVMVDGVETVIPSWLTNKVHKGSGTYSNSKLFDLLNTLGYLKEYEGNTSLDDDAAFNNWINAKLKADAPKCQVTVKNSNKGTDNEYSSVREILKVYKK